MDKFCANIFWLATTWNYLRSSAVYKKQHFQSWQFCSPNIFGAKIEISGTNRVKKIPIHFFSTFGSKINEFVRKKTEIYKEIQTTQRLQTITLTCNSHKCFKCFNWKIEMINFYYSNFCKLLRTVCSSKKLLSNKYWRLIYI